jgi:hypothetical protein
MAIEFGGVPLTLFYDLGNVMTLKNTWKSQFDPKYLITLFWPFYTIQHLLKSNFYMKKSFCAPSWLHLENLVKRPPKSQKRNARNTSVNEPFCWWLTRYRMAVTREATTFWRQWLTLNFNGSFKRTIENNTLYYVSCNSQRIYETPSHNLYQLLGRCFTSQDISSNWNSHATPHVK